MDEKQLVRQVLSGSDSAIRLLISKYERLVIHMVARVVSDNMDREELCQDVFVKVIDKLSGFHFESKLSTWIATIAYRTAVNFAKKKKLVQVDLDEIAFKTGNEPDITEEEDMKSFILKLIDQLPVNYKTVLTLFYLDGFSYPEIMEVTGMPEGTVKNYIHRARLKLKKIVEDSSRKEIALL
ncbi:sigma-70 family RNA polymerase sigma factor [Ekhidna sp.]|uniref:RNA polymerase sigma factor n=1 Tax=Ekhidna sp. TaxID=2608089 RepID=UPI003299DEF5